MTYAYSKDHNRKRMNSIYTPPHIAKFVYKILESKSFEHVLDPACGTGNLLTPWPCRKVGIDIDPMMPDQFYATHLLDFLKLTWWDKPELVLCNPPWAQVNDRRHMPDKFIRQIVNLFGNKIPIVYFVPMGFRLNQSYRSQRWRWLRENLEITSIITLPLDAYPETKFHSEILFFNIDGVKPHYFLPCQS